MKWKWPNSDKVERLKPFAVLLCVALLAAILGFINRYEFAATDLGDEYQIIEKILSREMGSPRWLAAVQQLSATPEKSYPFYSRWLIVHEVDALRCWSDKGHAPTASELPRDIQILEAAAYGHADILNGGFHQFFSNSTGVVAPELVEFFQRSELDDTASIIEEAMGVFGEDFPRARAVRNETLAKFASTSDSNDLSSGDPFSPLDEAYYESLSRNGADSFEVAANRWLRRTCGIRSLEQAPTRASAP